MLTLYSIGQSRALYPNPDFQSSIRVVLLPRLPVLEGYYFVRPEPLKITKSASSSTPCKEQDYRFDQQSEARISGRDSHPTCIVIDFQFSNAQRPKPCVVRVSKYNRFSLACKPPASNELQHPASADAQSSQIAPIFNPGMKHVKHDAKIHGRNRFTCVAVQLRETRATDYAVLASFALTERRKYHCMVFSRFAFKSGAG